MPRRSVTRVRSRIGATGEAARWCAPYNVIPRPAGGVDAKRRTARVPGPEPPRPRSAPSVCQQRTQRLSSPALATVLLQRRVDEDDVKLDLEHVGERGRLEVAREVHGRRGTRLEDLGLELPRPELHRVPGIRPRPCQLRVRPHATSKTGGARAPYLGARTLQSARGRPSRG